MRLSFPVALMAHRGGALEFVENTLPAFRNAALLNPDILELDCQLTKDGYPVIFHDNDLGRMCGLKGKKIQDYNLSELPKLRIPAHITSNTVLEDPQSYEIPLFEALLKEFPHNPMQVDVKNGPEELVVKVAELIRKYNRENITVWGSFRYATNNLCRKHGPDIPLFYEYRRALISWAMSITGLWPVYVSLFKPIESCLILPNIGIFMNKAWFKRLNSIGISVIAYGKGGSINTVKGYLKARSAGVNGICTDDPRLLKKWLETNQLATGN